jgi:signal transduction histidine kinase
MKVSLSWKWVIASLVIECFMLSLMVMKNVNQLENDLSTITHTRLNEQKILLQSALAAPLVQMDYATIDAILKETITIPNINYLIVVDNKNNCLSSIEWEDCTKLPVSENNPFDKKSLADGQFDTSIAINIASQNLGKVYLGLSTEFYIQAKEEMINRSILIALVELLLSAVLLIAISKWITQNLISLTHTANAIAHGDYSQRIDLGDSKETSELQSSFNMMIINIQKNIHDLEISYKEQKLLSEKVQSQLLKNYEQNELLKQQSRMAAMGEMLANIAHQWRQPLNAITVHLSSMKLKNELHIIEENEINNTVDNVMKYASYLSNTIDDFRNFISNDSIKENFSIQKSFHQAKDIVSLNLTNQNITLDIINNNEELFTNGIKNELIQVFINILNNAKDVLIEHNIEHKVIQVSFYKKEHNTFITIQDNAGGIKEDIIDKIFDPYFTTKHQSQGTGIGLYMSSRIIHEHFYGEIFVKNEDIIFENNNYKGAKFYIILTN